MEHRRLIAEWEPQSGAMIAWPHASTDWSPHLKAVETIYVQLAYQITRGQTLAVCVQDREHHRAVTRVLRDADVDPARVRFCTVRFDDTWVRDYGPFCVDHGGRVELHEFRFDGWGGKFSAHWDNLVNREVQRQGLFGNATLHTHDWVLEGGSIDTDGRGTLLTNRTTLLETRRNASLTQAELEERLRAGFGVSRVLWLEANPLEGDDTDGHVDTLARFCDPATIAYTTCSERGDPQFKALQQLADQLRTLRRADGAPYRLQPLPLPGPCYREDGARLPANYANFLIINNAVLVPLYNDPADSVALAALANCFPGRRIVGIDCLPLIREAGAIHCATLQLAAGILNRTDNQVAPDSLTS